ncbi:MAG TPA: RNA-binding S4 domain-containing protein [Symbiobacteriaceae bacterium]|jgi:ribosome-associated protein|nr:RNA-binding S4 domain-containing protein [Symbiobacteriaceae bacterium]
MPEQISISTDFITLDAFLKWAGVADTGGHAKALVASGVIRVNNEAETRRGRKLRPGDEITVPGHGSWLITREEA